MRSKSAGAGFTRTGASRIARAGCAMRNSPRSSRRALRAAAAPAAARACSAICAEVGERCGKNRIARLMRGELTPTTLALAMHRQPPPPGLLHHSDRGSQYAADAFARLAATRGITLSMSRPANPYDNALAERLPGASAPALRAACGRLSRSARLVVTLKAECFDDSIPPTRAAAELMASDYIETFCNCRRRHSSLGQRSPRNFEALMFPHNPNIPTN